MAGAAKIWGMSRSGAVREKWTRIIREQRESGQSVASFCARRGIAVSSFYPWKRRLAVGDTPAFVEATIADVPDERGGVMIQVGAEGRRVIVTPGFDRRLLLEVLDALESCGPAGAGARA